VLWRSVARVGGGGGVVDAGAGSSGRAAAADAAECGPTFSTDRIVAVTTEEEAGEDDAAAGARALSAHGVDKQDVVLGVSASGRTPYTLAALEQASKDGALTIALACVRDSELAARTDRAI